METMQAVMTKTKMKRKISPAFQYAPGSSSEAPASDDIMTHET